MGEKTNTDLGLGARAWEASKIYLGSNTVNHLAASVDTSSIETLGNFTKRKAIETRGIDPDTKADDLLLKYTVSRITPERHLDEVDNATEIYLITDEHGHDIGTYEITENGPIFKLSPKIREYNEKIIATFPEAEQEILRSKYRTDNLEELVTKLAKGEKIALASKEQARDDIEKEYEERGLSNPDGTTNEDPEEEKAISGIPTDMRAEIIEKCREKGISIKHVLVVDKPSSIIEEIDNEKVGIRKNKGPVILVRARSGDISSQDDVYAFQDGKELTKANLEKEELSNLMEQHKNRGAIRELTDDKEESVRDSVMERLVLAEAKIEHLETADFASSEDKKNAIMKVKGELASEVKSIVDYYDYEDPEMDRFVESLQMDATEEQANMDATSGEYDDGYYKNRWESADPNNPHN